jgi:diadenosine tetraphosphate (Ap4A) HIT family hydrolase
MYDNENIFAKILRGEIPCKKVYEDPQCLVFHDIHPKAPLHLVIIPKHPYVSFADFVQHASEMEISHFFKTVAEIAKKFKVDQSGYRLMTNNGPDSGQEVPHFHVHLLGWKKE